MSLNNCGAGYIRRVLESVAVFVVLDTSSTSIYSLMDKTWPSFIRAFRDEIHSAVIIGICQRIDTEYKIEYVHDFVFCSRLQTFQSSNSNRETWTTLAHG